MEGGREGGSRVKTERGRDDSGEREIEWDWMCVGGNRVRGCVEDV